LESKAGVTLAETAIPVVTRTTGDVAVTPLTDTLGKVAAGSAAVRTTPKQEGGVSRTSNLDNLPKNPFT